MQGLKIAVAGIPKTIDNDVDYIDRSFGFVSAVEAAQDAIRCAKTEATCNLPNGIGIVKLMGRSAGYIAAHATLGSGDVDLVSMSLNCFFQYCIVEVIFILFLNTSFIQNISNTIVPGSRSPHCFGGTKWLLASFNGKGPKKGICCCSCG